MPLTLLSKVTQDGLQWYKRIKTKNNLIKGENQGYKWACLSTSHLQHSALLSGPQAKQQSQVLRPFQKAEGWRQISPLMAKYLLSIMPWKVV